MKKVEKVILCYFFDRIEYNPKDKIKELSDEVKSLFDESFVFSNEETNHLFSLPRIQAISKDKKLLFQMSLINANISFNALDMDMDEVILWINNHLQLFFDVLKNVYNVKILYSSLKIVSVDEVDDDPAMVLSKRFCIEGKYENITFNRGYTIDNSYYVNILLNSNKEYNYNFSDVPKPVNEHDLFDLTMITSLSKAESSRKYILETIEINDRLAFNNNSEYVSNKESIRGMILELKKVIKKENI